MPLATHLMVQDVVIRILPKNGENRRWVAREAFQFWTGTTQPLVLVWTGIIQPLVQFEHKARVAFLGATSLRAACKYVVHAGPTGIA